MKHIKLVILFGSQATGKAGKRSDTDIAVLGDHPLTIGERVSLSGEIAKKRDVSEDDIDITDLWHASPLLQFQVAKYGELLEGTDFDFIRFKVLSWKRYQDTAKLRRLREKSLEHYFSGAT